MAASAAALALCAGEAGAALIFQNLNNTLITHDGSEDAGVNGSNPYTPHDFGLSFSITPQAATSGGESKGEEGESKAEEGTPQVSTPFSLGLVAEVTNDSVNESKEGGESKDSGDTSTAWWLTARGEGDSKGSPVISFVTDGLGAGDAIDGASMGLPDITFADWDTIGAGGYIGFVADYTGVSGASVDSLYGWVAVSRTATDQLTFHEWAYDNSGAVLLAGQGGSDLNLSFGASSSSSNVPEPASVLIMGSGLAAALIANRMLRPRV